MIVDAIRQKCKKIQKRNFFGPKSTIFGRFGGNIFFHFRPTFWPSYPKNDQKNGKFFPKKWLLLFFYFSFAWNCPTIGVDVDRKDLICVEKLLKIRELFKNFQKNVFFTKKKFFFGFFGLFLPYKSLYNIKAKNTIYLYYTFLRFFWIFVNFGTF